MKLGTKFSLTTIAVIFVISVLLELISIFIFTRQIHTLNKDLFSEKLDRLVSFAYEQDELFFEGVSESIQDGQRRTQAKLDALYRNYKDPGTFIFVVDSAGKIIFHPAESRWRDVFAYQLKKGDILFGKDALTAISQNNEGEFNCTSPDSIKSWCVFKKYEPWDWVFCMTTTQRNLNTTTISFIHFAVVVSSFVILISIFITFIISRKYTKPIHLVIEQVQKIAKGEISSIKNMPLNIETNDEIGMLSRAVNKMAEDLSKVTVSRNELIKEIKERSRAENELKNAYEKLKDTQAKLVQSEKMAAIGQLAGGVAHEINNPMGVILGFAQSIVKSIKEDEPLYMPLKSIEREAIRCKKLVGDLLTFSRAGKTEKEISNINEVVEQSLSLVEAQAKVKNVQIIKGYGDNLPQIEVNKNQIQQVIINLCNNAVDAMAGGGNLAISTKLKVKSEKLKEIEISVSDTGSGMTEEVKKHIFEPFFTTKEVGKGTGLGLSLAYEIIQKHNGSIEVTSEVGKGTIFFISLPVGDKPTISNS